MALVTCPKCKRTVSNTSNKCPNCGGALSYSAFDKNAPKHTKYHLLSNIFLGVSFVLLFAEFSSCGKTYVGGVLFGIGFLFQGLSMLGKKRRKRADAGRSGESC
jgi:hypothetical protein